MDKLVLIKLGGSLITDKNKAFTAHRKVIARLAREIELASKNFKGRIIIGHGSGSFGHTVAAKYKTQEGIINRNSLKGFPLVANAAKEINSIVMIEFLKIGLLAVSFSPVSFIESENRKPHKCFTEPIKRALDLNLLPVIYGDVVFDAEKQGFCIFSGEKSLNLLASNLKGVFKKISIIYCGETNGVYNALGEVIPKITPNNFKSFVKDIKGSAGVDVTGGMLHKVEESLEIAKKLGIRTVIINGSIKGNLQKAILGKDITRTIITN